MIDALETVIQKPEVKVKQHRLHLTPHERKVLKKAFLLPFTPTEIGYFIGWWKSLDVIYRFFNQLGERPWASRAGKPGSERLVSNYVSTYEVHEADELGFNVEDTAFLLDLHPQYVAVKRRSWPAIEQQVNELLSLSRGTVVWTPSNDKILHDAGIRDYPLTSIAKMFGFAPNAVAGRVYAKMQETSEKRPGTLKANEWKAIFDRLLKQNPDVVASVTFHSQRKTRLEQTNGRNSALPTLYGAVSPLPAQTVDNLCSRLGIGEQHKASGYDFLTSRLESLVGHETYPAITQGIMEDELQLFYYLSGALPIRTEDGFKIISMREDLGLLRPFKLGAITPKRTDNDLFRLYRRISERHRAKRGPSWSELIDSIGSAAAVARNLHRPITYDDVLAPVDALARYLGGIIPVRFKSGEEVRLSLENLSILTRSGIRDSGDARLQRLYKRIGGADWYKHINLAGRKNVVEANIGRIVVGGDVRGTYELEEAIDLLKHTALSLPMEGEKGKPTLSDILALHVFPEGYKNLDSGRSVYSLPHDMFRRIYKRAKSSRAPTPHEVASSIFHSTALVRKYGRAFNVRQLDAIALLNQYVDRLESCMLGERPVTVNGLEKTLHSLQDMRFLAKSSKEFRVNPVQAIRKTVTEYQPELGIGYYDLFDLAGARQRVAEKYSRAVTRADANPALKAVAV
ncbi:hypothetical protein HYV83_04935 [Candidatus Woesearchaeota archaeon]|nr:hypothetical protein [Candidatus Woesearchaeota archaeon]